MAITTNIKVKGITLTPAIRSYVEEKVAILEKHLTAADVASGMVEVEIGQTTKHHRSGANLFSAELNLLVPGDQFYAKAEEADLYAAIDLAKDGLVGEVTKARKKKNTLFRRGGRALKNILRGEWPK